MSDTLLSARVHNIRYEAPEIISIELTPGDCSVVFPPHEAGSHIDLHLGNGLVRHYSLLNPCTDTGRYVVGVLKDRKSRGGSKYLHEHVRVGELLAISKPRNNFAVDETASHSVFVAGGIGLTPILCMLGRLLDLGRSVELIYCTKSRPAAAFLQGLQQMALRGLKLRQHFDDEAGGPPDLKAMLAEHKEDVHLYACGPAPMLDSFQQACSDVKHDHVHIERFAAAQSEQVKAVGFTVELRRSAQVIEVAAGASILDAMLAAGLLPSHSCGEGICGECETKVLAGEVEHRDSILTESEREANKSMMICVSRCRSTHLVLDA